jgi:hypothetical protein
VCNYKTNSHSSADKWGRKNLIIYSGEYGTSITKCGCEKQTFLQLHKARLPFACVLDQFNPCHSLTTEILYYTSNDILVDQVASDTFSITL